MNWVWLALRNLGRRRLRTVVTAAGVAIAVGEPAQAERDDLFDRGSLACVTIGIRNQDWRASDRGRRLDHIWVTPDLKTALRNRHPDLSHVTVEVEVCADCATG